MIRQYSLSQAPKPDEFRIFFKRENDNDPNDVVSNYLYSNIDEGNQIKVSAPAGVFVLDTTNPPIASISGGVGLTSMMMDDAYYKTVYSGEPNGFITREMFEEYVNLANDVYVCGPAPFMEIMIRELNGVGIPEEQIHYEFFGPGMDLNTKN